MKNLNTVLLIVTVLTLPFTLQSHAGTIQLPQTGQTTCYNASGTAVTCVGTGQDGENLAGVAWPSPRFVDNADGTVTDKLTGLIWSKDANPSSTARTWQEALDYVKTLNTTKYMGYSDWRLPNKNELRSLLDLSSLTPILPAGHPFTNVQVSSDPNIAYWSSTSGTDQTYTAFAINMSNGNMEHIYKVGYYTNVHIWPVRGGQFGALSLPKTGQTTCYNESGSVITCSGTGQDGELQNGTTWPTPRFSDNSDQTMTDNLTGLVWSKNSNPAAATKTWQQALDYIKSLNSSSYLGHNDWRLPNPNDLQSLVNIAQTSSATWLNGQGFTNVQADFYWSSSTYTASSLNAWTVSLLHGTFYNGSKTGYSYYVWPVRGGLYSTLTVSKTGTGTGSVTSSPSAISCGSSCSASITTGTAVTLTATPDSGSSFSGWSGACSGNGTCQLTMDTAKSVTATFSTQAPVTPTTPSITWRHQGVGEVYGMTTDGSSITGGSQYYSEADQAWAIVGQGDFDGDGIRDFVWQNSTTGQVYLMPMSGPTTIKTGTVIYTEPNTNWKIVATGDINGDGKTDLIWWNKQTGQVSVMLLNGTTIASVGLIYTEPDTTWKIVAAADFNGNGTAELLWWNSATGQVAIGQTNGTSASTVNLIWTEPDTNWRIAGAGDLDGDGKADIIWHHKTTGQLYGMQTNGTTVTNGALIYTEPDTNWLIASIGRYNSDTKAELLWWNQKSGQTTLMTMNGLKVSGAAQLTTGLDSTWHIQGETEWRDNVYGKGITTTSAIPVNGVCGTSNGGMVATAPTTNLCSTGTASTVTGSGPWSWTCSGSNGGTTASCSASLQATTTIPISWKHQGDGKIYGMTTNGSSLSGGSQYYQETNQAWSIVGQGDFDGDGIRDFVWQNSSTGQISIMLMSGPATVKSGAVIYTEANTNWKIAATGDINGDGKTDLIWWNKQTGQVSVMLLNGTTVISVGLIYTEPDTTWKIVAAADFNGNGTAELLWWNSATGQVAIGQTNGTSASTVNLIWTESNTDWRIAGAGDLDGDGKADIIWHNRTTGQVYGMQTNGSSVTNGAMMYTEANVQWEIVSVGNFNSDTKADLLWWNQLTGQVYIMPMNGLALAQGGALFSTGLDTTWHIQGETEWRDNLYGSGVTTTTTAPTNSATITDPTTGMVLVKVTGGTYTMGDTFGDGYSNETPTHQVTLSDFYIGRYEVTQGQWKAVMGSNPSSFTACGDNCPVEQVSWNDIQTFITTLNQRSGKSYRLPTEAEWEYAARSGGKSEKYSGSSDVNAVAWYSGNAGSTTHQVGQKQANGLGLYDMSGNVWEWVSDWYGAYSSTAQTNPTGPTPGSFRVFRGGSWYNDAPSGRASLRNYGNPSSRTDLIGFRLAAPVQ